MTASHTIKKTLHHHELRTRLQKEVDAILGSVHEDALYAEFKEEEIVNVYNGTESDAFTMSFEERMIVAPFAKRHSHKAHKVAHSTHPKPRTLRKKLRHIITFLFKPFEY